MACAKTETSDFELSRHAIDYIVLVDDDEMRDASRRLWFELGLAADLSGAAAVAALRTGKLKFGSERNVCALVCGAGPEALVG